MGPHGGIHRIANCQATKEGFFVQTRLVSHQGEPAEIVNCRLIQVAAEVSKQDAVNFRNSVLLRLDLNAEFMGKAGEGGPVEFDRCLFWSVEPIATWRGTSRQHHGLHFVNHSQPIAVRNCYFAPPIDLIYAWITQPRSSHTLGAGSEMRLRFLVPS